MRDITTGGGLWVGWCLDSLCGGSIMGSLVCHLPLCSRSQYQGGLSRHYLGTTPPTAHHLWWYTASGYYKDFTL